MGLFCIDLCVFFLVVDGWCLVLIGVCFFDWWFEDLLFSLGGFCLFVEWLCWNAVVFWVGVELILFWCCGLFLLWMVVYSLFVWCCFGCGCCLFSCLVL